MTPSPCSTSIPRERRLLHKVQIAKRGIRPHKSVRNSDQYRTAYSDEDFLDVIRAADGQPSTPEVADALGCANRTALVRLHDLADAEKDLFNLERLSPPKPTSNLNRVLDCQECNRMIVAGMRFTDSRELQSIVALHNVT